MAEYIIQGSPYSCVSDTATLKNLKDTIDYHTKYMGNSTKSTITPAELEKLKAEYVVAKAKYDASDCGKDPDRDKCLSLQGRIGSMRSSITYAISTRDNEHAETLKASLNNLMNEYKSLNCDAKISEYKGGVVQSIADVYQQMDKERIQKETDYQFKQRLFFGGLVLFGALLMVATFKKK